MIKYLGNTENIIDWNSIIKICQNCSSPSILSVKTIFERVDNYSEKLREPYVKVISAWKKAGYDVNSIEWREYNPDEHFPIEIENIFSNFVNLVPLRTFISEVLPGSIVPYHWDIEDCEEEWTNDYRNLKRITCCMDESRFGSILVFDKDFLYNNNQGDVYEWNHHRDYHSAANASEYPQYYFHLLGYK